MASRPISNSFITFQRLPFVFCVCQGDHIFYMRNGTATHNARRLRMIDGLVILSCDKWRLNVELNDVESCESPGENWTQYVWHGEWWATVKSTNKTSNVLMSIFGVDLFFSFQNNSVAAAGAGGAMISQLYLPSYSVLFSMFYYSMRYLSTHSRNTL